MNSVMNLKQSGLMQLEKLSGYKIIIPLSIYATYVPASFS